MSNEPCHKKEIQKLRGLKERGQGNHAQQVRKFESALKEAKHNLRGRNTTIPGATSDSYICDNSSPMSNAGTETAYSRYSKFPPDIYRPSQPNKY